MVWEKGKLCKETGVEVEQNWVMKQGIRGGVQVSGVGGTYRSGVCWCRRERGIRRQVKGKS